MNRKKRKLLLVGIILMVVLTTIIMKNANRETIKHDYTFVGESENWSGEFVLKGTEVFYEEDGRLQYDSQNRTEFSVMYKGEVSELATLKKLVVSYDSPAGSGKTEATFDEPPRNTVFSLGRSGGSGAMVKKDDGIEVSVQWDGETETFELRDQE